MHLARTLSLYIARQFLLWFGSVFGTMVSVTFLLDYIELLRRGGTRQDATWGLLLQMAALKLPHTAQEVMPFAILFGTMLAFWRLTRSNELVVARAAGVSVWGFLAPAIVGRAADRRRRRDVVQPDRRDDAGELREAREPHPARRRRPVQPVEPGSGCARVTRTADHVMLRARAGRARRGCARTRHVLLHSRRGSVREPDRGEGGEARERRLARARRQRCDGGRRAGDASRRRAFRRI